jgi:hypothetical protein
MRVATAGTLALAEDYGNSVATAGLILMSTGPTQLPDWLPVSNAWVAAWAVTDWYLDVATGNDTNDGTTAATPLATGTELLRRLGPYAIWNHSVTVHIGPGGLNDPLTLRGTFTQPSTHLDILGTVTQLVDAGTVATYVGIDHTIPRAPQVTATGIADWTPYVGKRLRLTDGADAGAVTWVAVANPAGAGIATARTPRWARIDTASVNNLFALINPTVGTKLVVETLPHVPAIDVLVDGAETSTSGVAQWPLRMFAMQSIDCPLVSVRGRLATEFARGMLFGSKLGGVDTTPASIGTGNSFNAVACYVGYANTGTSVRYWGMSSSTACLIGAGAFQQLSPSVPLLMSSCLFQGAYFFEAMTTVLKASTLSDYQVFDLAGAGNAALYLVGQMQVNNASGSNNAGFGYQAFGNCLARLAGTQNLQGAVANFRLMGGAAINLTIPQGLQPSDYAQKGITPAMVAGATTVTVPWYDNATQQVTAVHASFGGTPGVLSVQQISNTQFTITSSSNLDTSTVRWQISPLGRNIFVSVA